jgi:hypothetical protein
MTRLKIKSVNQVKLRAAANKIYWKQETLSFTPIQQQLGTCAILASGMGLQVESGMNRYGEKVFRFGFYKNARWFGLVEDVENMAFYRGEKTYVRVNTKNDYLTGGASETGANALEAAYSRTFGKDTLLGNPVNEVMTRLTGKSVSAAAVEWLATDTTLQSELSKALATGEIVTIYSDPEIKGSLVDSHAYRVTGSLSDLDIINPWSKNHLMDQTLDSLRSSGENWSTINWTVNKG